MSIPIDIILGFSLPMPVPVSMPMSVSVVVWVVRGTDILHFVDGAAFRAALHGSAAVHAEPDGPVGVDGVAGAACVLLVAGGVDYDGVV